MSTAMRRLLARYCRCTVNSRSSSSSSPAPSTPPRPNCPSAASIPPLPRTIASLLAPSAAGSQNAPSVTEEAETVTVHGWVKSMRKMKNVCFAHIADGTTSLPLQAVLSKPQAAGLSTGASLQVIGKWKASTLGTEQQKELLADEVRVLGEADPTTYPIQKKYQTAEFLRNIPHLRPRVPFNSAVLQLRSFVSSNLTAFFADREFVQCHPPIITSSDCEGAGEVFAVSSNESGKGHFFRSPKYLTVSAQLHLEALAAALPRVWTLSPTFRAEQSDTNRHLSEFYMLEAELSFIETLDVLLDLTEDMIRQLVLALMASRAGSDLLSLSGDMQPPLESRWKRLVQPGRWKRLSYSSAIKLLQTAVEEGKGKFEFPTQWGSSLQSEHEKYLVSIFEGPVFVTDYPRQIKPFYMLPSSPESPECKTVACFDLLLPNVGELIGGSLREHRYEELIENMKCHRLIPEGKGAAEAELKWYTDIRKWGSVPHGGFGMGLERLLCYLAGVENIREVVAFPRWVGRCDA